MLSILWQDARRNFKSIAEELGVSTSTLKARFNKMKESGLINGTTVEVDVYKLDGYIAQLCIRSIESKTQEVLDYIYRLRLEKANILCWECAGHYNILTWIYLKEPIKLHIIKHMVQQHSSVIEVNASIFTEFTKLYNLKLGEHQLGVRDKNNWEHSTIDETDAKIIDILIKNARTPFSRIAKTLCIGTDTVFRRYKRLLKHGIITKSTVVLDSRLFGFDSIIDFLIKLKPNADRDGVRNQLAEIENLLCVAKAFGDHDLYISSYFTDFRQIIALIRRIKQMEEVVGLEPLMYLTQGWTIPIVSATNIAGTKPETPSILKPFL
jgi:Lrp/AsnC family transcriptional regulator, regulator for asnA, asnC and gidA